MTHGVEAGRQHLWDFDTSPENKLATVNAGPPIKKGRKTPSRGKTMNKKRGRAADADEEEAEMSEEVAAEDDSVMPSHAELSWWDYGVGPPAGGKEQAPSAKKGKGRKSLDKRLSQPAEPESDDAVAESDEHNSDSDQGDWQSQPEVDRSSLLCNKPACSFSQIFFCTAQCIFCWQCLSVQ